MSVQNRAWGGVRTARRASSCDLGRGLVTNIRDELHAQVALRGLTLDDETLDGLAAGIATNIDYGFDVTWAPRWVKDNDPHRWVEGRGTPAESHFVGCLRCRVITQHPAAEAGDEWWEGHVATAHQ